MVSAGDFKNGITIEMDGNIYQIIEFQHEPEPELHYGSGALQAGTIAGNRETA